jgi:hypothetical protein
VELLVNVNEPVDQHAPHPASHHLAFQMFLLNGVFCLEFENKTTERYHQHLGYTAANGKRIRDYCT